MRIPIHALCLLLPTLAGAADRGKVSDGLERLLYVTDKSGVRIYDINDSHKLLRKIEVPETGDYKGISASVQLGKLYLTSYRKDELVCLDLATEKILWRRHYSDGYADSQAMTPDGKTIYLPLRDGDSWWVIDAATGDQWGGKMLYRVEAKTPLSRVAQIPNPPARPPHSTPSHGVNLRPDQKEAWMVDGVYGYVYVYDITSMPPRHVADVALFQDPSEKPHPGWISFSLDGKYAYPDGGAVIATATKKVAARIPTSEKLIEIDFRDGKPVKAGHR